MTDAVFSFGTEGLDSLQQVESALGNLARVSEDFKAVFAEEFGTNFIPPQTVAELNALIEKIGLAELAISEIGPRSATEFGAAEQAVKALRDAMGVLASSTGEVTAGFDASAAAAERQAAKVSAAMEKVAAAEAAAAEKSAQQRVAAEQLVSRSIDQRIAIRRADMEAALAAADAEVAAAERVARAEELAAKRVEERTTFKGGLARGARRGGDNLASGFGYNLARQGEFAMGMVAQFAAFDAVFEGVKQAKEYQSGVADLNIAMNEGKPVAQEYLNTLANLSRVVGENAADAFDSAAAGVRAFGALLEEEQGRPLSTQQKQSVGLAVTQSATQLGIIGGEGQKVATDQVVAIGTAYGLQAAELSQVTDAIAATKREVGGEPGQIAAGLARFAKSGSNAGLDINGAAALIGLVQARTGESGDNISSSLSRILQTTSGTSGIKLASQFSGDQNVSVADRKTLSDSNSTAWQRLQALSDIYRDGNTATQNRILSVVGGVRNRAEASSLLSEMPLLNKFNADLNSDDPRKGAAGQGVAQFDQQMRTLSGTIKKIEGDLKNIASDVSNSGLVDAFGALAHAIDPVLTALDGALRLLGELDHVTGGGSGAVIGAGELVGAAALYGKLKSGGADATQEAAATAQTEAAAVQERAAAAQLEAAGLQRESAIVGGVSNAEGGLLGKFGGVKGAGLFGGLGLMALGGAISDGKQGSTRNNIGNIASDAGMGAMLGSFIGPEGTVIGAGIGASIGGVQSIFESNAKNQQNQAVLDSTRAAAEQRVASGDFAKAVQDFKSAAANLKNQDDKGRSDTAGAIAKSLEGLEGDGTAERLKALLTPAMPASANPTDMALAGIQDQRQRREARAAIAKLPSWNQTDLQNSITERVSLDDGILKTLVPRRRSGGGLTSVDPNYESGIAGAGGGSLTKQGRASAEELLRQAVRKAISQLGASNKKPLTEAQIISVVKNALPGLSENQLNGLIPKIKTTLDSLAKGDGVAGTMKALATFNSDAAPEFVAAIDQIRKAHLRVAKTQSEMESINRRFGSLEVKAAGTNANLIAQVFSTLDRKTIDFIRGAAADALAAEKAAAKMASDISAGLKVAIESIGGTVGNNAAIEHDQAVVDAMNQASQAANSVALPHVGGGGGGGGKKSYDFKASAIAEAKAARSGAGELANAQAAITAAQDQMKHAKKNSADWWKGYGALWQAKEQLIKAEIDNAETKFLLGHDFTSPIRQAEAAVKAAEAQLKADKKNHFSAEIINKDKLSLAQAEAASQKAVFDQEMTNVQNKMQLGQMSQAAYVRWLTTEEKSLEGIKNMTQQQKDELTQVQLALQQANDSMNSQFNLTSIDARGLVYQVRAMGQIAANSRGAIPGAGIVNTNSNNTSVTIVLPAGSTMATAAKLAKDTMGNRTVTTRVRRA